MQPLALTYAVYTRTLISSLFLLQFVVKKENAISWTNRSSEVSSRVVELSYVNDKNVEFNITKTANNGTIEMWLDTDPSALLNLTRNDYQRTRLVDEAMDYQAINIRKGGVLFVDVIRETNISIYRSLREANLTSDISWLNKTYLGKDIQFQIFIGVDRRPTEEDFDAFCELPRKARIPCSLRMDADMPPSSAAVLESEMKNDPSTNSKKI